jgi:plasmid stabilization system protein ParE
MNYRLVPSAEANDDVFGIARYLSDQREDLGFRFYDCVDATYQQIAENPQWKGLGHFRQAEIKNIRVCPVEGFPNHFVFYRVVADTIEIIRVLHGARDYMSLFDGL